MNHYILDRIVYNLLRRKICVKGNRVIGVDGAAAVEGKDSGVISLGCGRFESLLTN